MAIVQVKPETILLNLPGQSSIYISLGTARDLMDELGRMFMKRVAEGKGLV
jgi:hypothetical protein